jgi:hypothetical protein
MAKNTAAKMFDEILTAIREPPFQCSISSKWAETIVRLFKKRNPEVPNYYEI